MKIAFLVLVLFATVGIKTNADSGSAAMSGAAAAMSAAAIASSERAASAAGAAAAMQNVKADGMFVCLRPEGDGCLVDRVGCDTGDDLLKYPEYIKLKIGYEAEIVSLAYNGHTDEMYIYFRKR